MFCDHGEALRPSWPAWSACMTKNYQFFSLLLKNEVPSYFQLYGNLCLMFIYVDVQKSHTCNTVGFRTGPVTVLTERVIIVRGKSSLFTQSIARGEVSGGDVLQLLSHLDCWNQRKTSPKKVLFLSSERQFYSNDDDCLLFGSILQCLTARIMIFCIVNFNTFGKYDSFTHPKI